MREIKFRAWDTTNKKMIQVRQIIIPDGNNEYGVQEIAVSGLKFGTNPSHWLIAPPLMQYTGLKDKNGKEIYEGDIVAHLVYGGNYKVVYSCDNTGYDLVNTNLRSMHLTSKCQVNIEVIGNIYENPELLEEKP